MKLFLRFIIIFIITITLCGACNLTTVYYVCIPCIKKLVFPSVVTAANPFM